MPRLWVEDQPQEIVITRFNGVISGLREPNWNKWKGIDGKILEPKNSQYRAAKSIIQTLEKLTYQKLGDLSELDAKADAVDNQLKGGIKDDYDF